MTALTTKELVRLVIDGNPMAVGRAISILADRRAGALELLGELYRYEIKGKVIGITGAPGAGKSTLVDSLIKAYRAQGRRVGVVAVDPSSPFTGGAILGDRLRMQRHATDPDVFVRSLASRGELGGLGPATAEAARVLGLAGFDPVLIETVGVGQAEIEVMGVADLVLLLVVPGNGDEVQCLKAGIMEIGDLFVVNKADRDGADRLMGEIESLLRLAGRGDEVSARIRRTVATTGDGVTELIDGLDALYCAYESDGNLARRRRSHQARQIKAHLVRELTLRFFDFDEKTQFLSRAVDSLSAGEGDPVTLGRAIIDEFVRWSQGEEDGAKSETHA